VITKIKQGISLGAQIGKVMYDKNFERKLNCTELAVWKSFRSSVHGFLGKKKRKITLKSDRVSYRTTKS
jgi:hypothetical protein